MVRVALTGGIASGKSAVAHMLRRLGAHVSQSDEVAREMMRSGQPLHTQIVEVFGSDVLTPEGELDRTKLARLAFQGGQLERLSALVHPLVMAAQERWLNMVGQQDAAAVAVVESALVLETTFRPLDMAENRTWRSCFDVVVTVSADSRVRQARYLQRSKTLSEAQAVEDFMARAAAQWSDAEREQHADVVLQNGGSLAQLEEEVVALYMSLSLQAAPERQSPAPASNMGTVAEGTSRDG